MAWAPDRQPDSGRNAEQQPDWAYSRVAPGESGASGSVTEAARMAESSGAKAPSKLSWVVPVALLFGAVFLQNAGLYSATCTYVRWMDEFSEAEQRSRGAPPVVEDVVLEDPLADLLGGWRLPPVPDFPWKPEDCAEALTAIVSLVWLGWVARNKDLQLWTKVMLSGALLAALKGLLTWTTVLPDAEGWHGCRRRLGEEGLAYFRQVASGGMPGGGPSMGGAQAAQDIALLSISNMWMMGRLGRQRVCADTVFSTPTCFSLLLAVGVYDLARSSTAEYEAVRRSTVRTIVGLALGLVLVVHLVLMLMSPQHYTLDVALALPLTLLVYTNPVTALAAKRWLDEWAAAAWSAVARPPTESNTALMAGDNAAAGAGTPGDGETGEATLDDEGEATVPPCCFPFCSLGGLFYLRGQPGSPALRPWTEECERRHQQQLAEFRDVREGFEARRRRLKEDIEKESKHIQEREAEVKAACERRVEEERRRVAERERGLLAEAAERLEAERRAGAAAEAKASELSRRSEAEHAALEERRGHLSRGLEAARQESAQAASAREEQRRGLEESGRAAEILRRASGEAAEEKQLEALTAFPEPVKDFVANGTEQDASAPSVPETPATEEAPPSS